jgi:transposase-like protein
MVRAVRGGASLRQVAARFGVALSTVQRWVTRAAGQRLDRVDWADRPCGLPTPVNRTERPMEDLVLTIRQQLRDTSDLGEFGAAAIHRELLARGIADPPSIRTIGLILQRRGALDYRRRLRRAPPPLGWYLPAVAGGGAELDSFDVVEGLTIQGAGQVEVLNGVSLHGGLVASWPRAAITARFVGDALVEHWRAAGLPGYAQFDNDALFTGAPVHPDTIGRVARVCLSLGVVPVWAPPREMGFQAAIEGFNGRWQAKVWARFHHGSLAELQARSARYVAAHRQRCVARREAAPARRPFPRDWQLDVRAEPQGRLIWVRRSNERGDVQVLGRTVVVDPLWQHRLVRAELDLGEHRLRVYALRRRAPDQQPLLKEMEYVLTPHRRFRG